MNHYRVIYPTRYLPAEKTAADVLSKYLALMTDAEFPVYDDSSDACEYEICVGATNRTQSEIPENREGYRIWGEGARLYILGGSDRGTLYGIYDYLRYLGCEFYSDDTEKIPHIADIALPSSPLTSAPAFEYRDTFWSCSYDCALSAKLHINGCVDRRLPPEWGGGIGYAGTHFVHTLPIMMPPDMYFDEHPEYYSEINGERVGKRLYSQLCLTNEDVFGIILGKVKEWLALKPEAKIVSVSQDDAYDVNTFCTCPKCAAVNADEGSPAGTLIRFVNRIAEEIEKDYPDVAIDTLAYQYSVAPPKLTVPRHNVIIRYCTGSCGLHPIEECEQNEIHRKNIAVWHNICNRIYIWDYTTNFAAYLTPFPNFGTLDRNARFFRDNGVLGVFEQGMYQAGKSGEFGEMRSYVLSKLLWNPELDVKCLMKDFAENYYGAAGESILKFIDFLTDKLTASGKHMRFAFMFNDEYGEFFSKEDAEFCDALWDSALSSVSGSQLEHTLRSHLCWRFLKINLGFSDEDERMAWKDDAMKLGVEMYNEGLRFDSME